MFVALLSCRHSSKLVLIFNKILVVDLITSYLESDVDVEQDFELDFSDVLEDGELRAANLKKSKSLGMASLNRQRRRVRDTNRASPRASWTFEEVEIEYKRKVVNYWRSGKKMKNLDNGLKRL